MEFESKWLLTDEEKDSFIATLTPNLTVLRTKAEISQEELANLIGVSRQTYSAIERKVRRMAWSTYLSLVLFYDHNQKTHKMIRQLSIFPKELIIRFNDGVDYSDYEISSFLGKKSSEIIEDLDEQAKGAIRAVVMMEYTRCKSISNDEVIKTLSGIAK
ncbi:MAG TPA: helix-turn-helix domain-containing protein [Candidatus Faeciplasma pullistercoris]|uniref:Helix-turn-helix domain-containing protein n=1 Tax=Candidatus Faeciplasma pullistercoris TaxID=2840800 RepID=A0A9D1KIQ5_9FIRM|nr:helix-turn-helix domain-containing protein [Candidatus Faeciplasma pullistercoris]